MDLTEVIAHVDAPLLVVSPREDFLLPPAEVELVRDAVRRAGGTCLLRRASHEGLSLSSRDFLAVELAFFDRTFPASRPGCLDAVLAQARRDGIDSALVAEGSPARERLDALLLHAVLPTPELSLAAALAHVPDDAVADLADWLEWLPAERLSGLDVHALTALLDGTDPAGRVGLDSSTAWSTDAHSVDDVLALFTGTVRAGKFAAASFGGDLLTGRMSHENLPGWAINTFIASRQELIRGRRLAVADVDRLTVRRMLKAACIPDRVVTAADGSHGVEILEHGAWHALAIP